MDIIFKMAFYHWVIVMASAVNCSIKLVSAIATIAKIEVNATKGLSNPCYYQFPKDRRHLKSKMLNVWWMRLATDN